MKILQIIGTIENGELKVNLPAETPEGEVGVILIGAEDSEDWEAARKLAIEKGYDSREKILDLIEEVKLEILAEKERKP